MLADLLEKSVAVVRESGEIIRDHWDKPRNVRHKGATDLVTETDVAVEQFLKEKLAGLLPRASFLAEESSVPGSTPGDLCWIIDPVDGTTNFVHRIHMVGTSVALWQDGRVVLGIVNAPVLGECFYAIRGHGAFCNGKAIKVSDVGQLSSALACTGFPYNVDVTLEKVIGRLGVVLPATQGLRRLGAASLDLAFVAAGRLDVFYEGGLKPWDVAAGWLLVEEAGGVVSSGLGSPYSFGGDLVASNPMLHQAISALMIQTA